MRAQQSSRADCWALGIEPYAAAGRGLVLADAPSSSPVHGGGRNERTPVVLVQPNAPSLRRDDWLRQDLLTVTREPSPEGLL